MLLGLAALCRLGPVSLGTAPTTWWTPLPVPRAALLRPVLRQRAVVAAVAGKDVTWLKAQAFALSAAIAALAGAFYGQYASYVAPDTFQVLVTVYVFLAVTAGGQARALGGTLGAYALIAFVEGTRLLADVVPGLTPGRTAALREIMVGVVLILLLRLRPEGLLPERNQKAPL